MSFLALLDRLKRDEKDGGTVVAQLLNKWLEERNHTAKEIEPWIHPSSLPPIQHICPRELFFQLYTPYSIYPVDILKKSHEAQTHRIFDNGTAFHRRWQSYFIEMGIMDPRVREGWEIPILDESINLMGHADGIVYPEAYGKNKVQIQRGGLANGEIPITTLDGGFQYSVEGLEWKPYGRPYMVEFKSMNDRMFENLSQPLDKHIMQGTVYAGWLREHKHPELSNILFLYENKNSQKFKEFNVPLDVDLWLEMKGILQRVRQSKEKKTLPKRICSSGLCERAEKCKWTQICFSVNNYNDLILKGRDEDARKAAKTRQTLPAKKVRRAS